MCLTYIVPRRFGNGVEATFYNRDIFITLLRLPAVRIKALREPGRAGELKCADGGPANPERFTAPYVRA